MNTLYKNFKTQLALVIMLLGANICFAQIQPKVVVKVPSSCKVVIAGHGGTIGNGGYVGDGGTVVMPDPFDYTSTSGNFICSTILDASTTQPVTLKSWSLKGDLSFQTTTTYNAALQNITYPATPVTTTVTQNIQSYNFKLRSAEQGPQNTWSNPAWGRSKGTMSISYVSSNACGGGISFEVFKKYSGNGLDKFGNFVRRVPEIVGPDCLEPNKTYTFSVDQIASDNAIGFDNYYWSCSGLDLNLLGLYTSADNSSITFTTPNALPTTPIVLKCGFGLANATLYPASGTTTTTFVTKTLGLLPTAPSIESLEFNTPNCIATGTATSTHTFLIVSGQTYQWLSSNPAWVLTQGISGTNYNLSIDYNGDNNPGKLTLKITSGCSLVEVDYQINRSLAPSLGITAVGGGVPATCISSPTAYSLPPTAIGNYTNWTIDTVPTGGTLPAGAPTVSNSLTAPNSSCTVTPGTAPGQYYLVATSNASTTCNNTNTKIALSISPAKPVFTTEGAICVLKGTTGIMSIQVDTDIDNDGTNDLPTTGYIWTFPTGWSVTPITATTSTPVFTSSNTGAGPVSISVRLDSGDCDSETAVKSVSYIGITATLQPTLGCDNYYINACGAAVTWTVNGNPPTGNYTLSPDGYTLQLCGAPTTAITVCATVAGIATPICVTNSGHGYRPAGNSSGASIDTKELIEGVSIFPNPNNGVFFIKVEDYKEEATATLNDFSGNEVATYTLKKGTNKLGNDELPKGTYFVVLKVDGKQETRQVIIK